MSSEVVRVGKPEVQKNKEPNLDLYRQFEEEKTQ